MKLSIIFYPEERDYTELLQGKTVIVLDILRATTSITTAIAHGAKEIIPVRKIEEALAFKGTDKIIAGEDNGLKPESFDLGNSPYEYRNNYIRNKSIAFRTRNGTQAIVLSKPADHLLIGAFVNSSACAKKAASFQKDIVIFCSGTRGEFSLEDSAAAGYLASILSQQYDVSLDDAGLLLAASFLEIKRNDFAVLKQSKSSRRLKHLDKWTDVEDCLQFDIYDVVPMVHQGVISLKS
ncbi:2-phosphosulfolactate phosphatase [Shimazuella sp. AN120528]|uniref:2-phosphosulfolactate phosphatase n=1 Tax=Shimazuella soli TaxID=1892854 RepID=UPI001F11308B|nr:2-phosphosulfolactate phosphatase [Shimazuella soli]MCH5584171.1 2-phosphosulfolactate phosphatase [Shimazuella soli]